MCIRDSSKVILSPPGSGNLPYANYIGVGQLIKTNGKFYGLYHGEFHNGTIIEYFNFLNL